MNMMWVKHKDTIYTHKMNKDTKVNTEKHTWTNRNTTHIWTKHTLHTVRNVKLKTRCPLKRIEKHKNINTHLQKDTLLFWIQHITHIISQKCTIQTQTHKLWQKTSQKNTKRKTLNYTKVLQLQLNVSYAKFCTQANSTSMKFIIQNTDTRDLFNI